MKSKFIYVSNDDGRYAFDISDVKCVYACNYEFGNELEIRFKCGGLLEISFNPEDVDKMNERFDYIVKCLNESGDTKNLSELQRKGLEEGLSDHLSGTNGKFI